MSNKETERVQCFWCRQLVRAEVVREGQLRVVRHYSGDGSGNVCPGSGTLRTVVIVVPGKRG